MATAEKAISQQDSVSGQIGTAVKHSFIYGFGGVFIKGIGFFLLPIYTHFLSTRDYGVFEVLELSVSLLGMFLNMGITAALLKYYGTAETEAEKRKVIGSIFLFTVATSAVILLAGSLSVRSATRFLLGPGVPSTYLLLSFTAFLLTYIANVPYTALRAQEASSTIVTYDSVSTIAFYGLNIYFIVAARLALLGLFLSRLIINSLYTVVLIKKSSRELFGGMDWGVLRKVIRFGAPLVFSNLTMFTLNFSDRFFLQRLESLEVVGIYAVGYKFGFMLNYLLIQPFNMMWQARMYIVHQLPDYEKVFSRIFVLYSSLLILAALGMTVLGPELMRLMVDPKYAAGAAVIGIVSLSYVFLGVGYYLQLGMFLASRTGLLGKVSVVAAILNLAANYFFIKYFGMVGAAWATALGFLALAVGSYYYSQRVFPLALPIGRMLRSLGLGMAVYWISRFIPASSLAIALLSKCALILAFPVLLWGTGCFSADELATLNTLRNSTVRKMLRLLKPAWLRV